MHICFLDVPYFDWSFSSLHDKRLIFQHLSEEIYIQTVKFERLNMIAVILGGLKSGQSSVNSKNTVI